MSDEGLKKEKGGVVGKHFHFSKVLSCLQSSVCRVIRMGFCSVGSSVGVFLGGGAAIGEGRDW